MFGLGKKTDDVGLLNVIAMSAATEFMASQAEKRRFDKNNTLGLAQRFLKHQDIKLSTEQNHTLMLGCGTLSENDSGVQLTAVCMQYGETVAHSALVDVKSKLETVGLTFNTPNLHKANKGNTEIEALKTVNSPIKPVSQTNLKSSVKSHLSDNDVLHTEKRPTKKESPEDKDFSDYFIPAIVVFGIMVLITLI